MLKHSQILKLKQVTHAASEARLLAACRGCPFVVRLLASFRTTGHFCLLLEYASGGELFSWLRRRRLSIQAVRFYAAQVVLALEHLHARGILYRDLKPENVLLSADGHAMLADFGFAKAVACDTYTACGTPEYMAPEELSGRGHGKEADLWAVGVLVFEMAVGRVPFAGNTNDEIYERICKCQPMIPPSIDSQTAAFLRALLVKDRSRRLGSIRGVAELKEHPFFAGIDFCAMLQKKIPPPIVPKVSHPGDTSNFIEYDVPEEENAMKTPFVKYRFDP